MRVEWKGLTIAPSWRELKADPNYWWPHVCAMMEILVDHGPHVRYLKNVSRQDYREYRKELRYFLNHPSSQADRDELAAFTSSEAPAMIYYLRAEGGDPDDFPHYVTFWDREPNNG